MEPTLATIRHEAIDDDELVVHEWRVTQLKRLGIPGPLADAAAEFRGSSFTTSAANPS